MALVGDLGSVDLAQVFQVLAQNQKDGVLEIYRGGDHRGLRFRRGTVTLQFDRDAYEERAIELLTMLGRVSEEKLQLAAANRSGSEAALLEVLVEMRILSEEEIISLFRERMAEELYDLFSWSDARFEFHEGASRLDIATGEIDDRLCFPSDALVMEAARRIDEWSHIRAAIPDDNEVFIPAIDELNPEDDLQAAVFVDADGMRSVHDIHKRVGRSRFEVTKAMARLIEAGSLRPLAAEEYSSRGQAAFAAGRASEAANLFDRAVAAEIDMPASLGMAGSAWESVGERAQAADRYVAFGDALHEAQDKEGALVNYRKAHDLVPTHLDAWKKLVLLALDLEGLEGHQRPELHPRKTRAHELADVFLEIGQSAVAIEVLERVVVRHPKDLQVKKTLISALDNSSNPQRLAELLESLAEELTFRGDTVGAAASLQRVMRIQPKRKDLSGKIRELYRRDERKRSRFKLVSILGLSAVLMGAVGFLIYSREERAKADLAAIDIDSSLSTGEFDKARLELREFEESHPFSLSLKEASAKLAIVNAADAVEKDKEALRKASETAVRQKRQQEAVNLASAADAEARAGNLPAALTGLRKALASAPPDWDQASDVLRNANDLETYLSGAVKLAGALELQLRERNFAMARETVKELTTKYPRSPEGTSARYPVEVRSSPPGATIELFGKAIVDSEGVALRTPAVISLAPMKKTMTIVVKLDGYEHASIVADPAKDGILEARLGRSSSKSFALPTAHAGVLTLDADRTYAGLTGGRVVAFTSAGEPLWNLGLSNGGELAFTPIVNGNQLIVGSTDGSLALVNAESGEIAWRVELTGGLRVPPLMTSEGVVVAMEDGRVRLLDRMTGERRREWRAGTRPAGTMALDGNELFIGCSDGRVRVLDYSNSRGDERVFPFGAPVSSLTKFDEVLLISGDDGSLTGYDIARAKNLWELPGGRIAASKPCVTAGRVAVEREGRLVSLDIRTGVIVASAPEALGRVASFSLDGQVLFAAMRDGTAVALDAHDLTVLWQWPGPGGGSLGAARDRKEAANAVVAVSNGVAIVAIEKQVFRFDPRALSGSLPASAPAHGSSRGDVPADSKDR